MSSLIIWENISIDIMFYCFLTVKDWSEELKERQNIILDIIRLAEALEVRFAFPTQTLHVENLPGQETLSPTHIFSKNKLMTIINRLRKKNGRIS